jgi:transcriptional regulator with XRE-family HTH domain
MATSTVESPRDLQLRRLRQLQNKGLREVARAIDVDSGYLSKIERGLVPPSLPTLLRLLKELGMAREAETIERLLTVDE